MVADRLSPCGKTWFEVAKGNPLPQNDIVRIMEFLGAREASDLCHMPWRGNLARTIDGRVVERLRVVGADGAGITLPAVSTSAMRGAFDIAESIFLCRHQTVDGDIPFAVLSVRARSKEFESAGDTPELVCRAADLVALVPPLEAIGHVGTTWRNGRPTSAATASLLDEGDLVVDQELLDALMADSVGFLVGPIGDRLRDWGVPAKRGILLHGPPGNGKTVLTRMLMRRALSEGLSVSIVEYRPPKSLLSLGPDLSDLLRDAVQRSPALIIFEDIDMHCGSRANSSDDVSKIEMSPLSQLTDFLDGVESVEGYVLVATTNCIEDLDPALRRTGRMDKMYEVLPPTLMVRQRVLEKVLRRSPAPVPPTDSAAALLEGASMSDVAEAGRRYLRHLAEEPASDRSSALTDAAREVALERGSASEQSVE